MKRGYSNTVINTIIYRKLNDDDLVKVSITFTDKGVKYLVEIVP